MDLWPFLATQRNGEQRQRIDVRDYLKPKVQEYSGLLGADGLPLRRGQDADTRYDEMPIPGPILFSAILGGSWRKYLADRFDEARRHSYEDSLAMERDTTLMGLIQERKFGTASLEWDLEVDNERDPHEKAMKDGLKKVLRSTPHLQKMILWELDAVYRGRSAVQLKYVWKHLKLPTPGGQPSTRRCLAVERWLPINGDKIVYNYDGTPSLVVNAGEADRQLEGAHLSYTSIGRSVDLLKTNIRHNFIIHAHEVSDADFYEADRGEAIYGVGLRHVLYWYWWLKAEWMANATDWLERAGLGVRKWYYQAGNEQSRLKVLKAAEDNVRRTNILIPRYPNSTGHAVEGMEYEDVATGGAEFMVKLIEYMDQKMERYVIGQTLSSDTEGSGLGGTGVADMHKDTKTKLIAFDANNLADTKTADWVEVVKWWTYPEYREVPCRFVFKLKASDPEKVLAAMRAAWEMGVEFAEKDVRDPTGTTAPEPGDKIVSKAVQDQQAAALQLQQQKAQADAQTEQAAQQSQQEMAQTAQEGQLSLAQQAAEGQQEMQQQAIAAQQAMVQANQKAQLGMQADQQKAAQEAALAAQTGTDMAPSQESVASPYLSPEAGGSASPALPFLSQASGGTAETPPQEMEEPSAGGQETGILMPEMSDEHGSTTQPLYFDEMPTLPSGSHLIEEDRDLQWDGTPYSRMDYGKKGEGKWITIGAKAGADGKKHGGSPVFVEGGRITKGHPNLHGKKIGAFHEEAKELGPRQAKTHEASYQRAKWSKEAKKLGVNPKDLHQLAAEMKANHDEFAKDKLGVMQEARRQLRSKALGGGAVSLAHTQHVEEPKDIPNLDIVAGQLAEQYPHLFSGKESPDLQLLNMFKEGNPELLPEEHAYQEALNHLHAHGGSGEEPGDAWEGEPGAAGDDEWDFPEPTQEKPVESEALRKAREHQTEDFFQGRTEQSNLFKEGGTGQKGHIGPLVPDAPSAPLYTPNKPTLFERENVAQPYADELHPSHGEHIGQNPSGPTPPSKHVSPSATSKPVVPVPKPALSPTAKPPAALKPSQPVTPPVPAPKPLLPAEHPHAALAHTLHGHLSQQAAPVPLADLRKQFGQNVPLNPKAPQEHPVHAALKALREAGHVQVHEPAGGFGEPAFAASPQPGQGAGSLVKVPTGTQPKGPMVQVQEAPRPSMHVPEWAWMDEKKFGTLPVGERQKIVSEANQRRDVLNDELKVLGKKFMGATEKFMESQDQDQQQGGIESDTTKALHRAMLDAREQMKPAQMLEQRFADFDEWHRALDPTTPLGRLTLAFDKEQGAYNKIVDALKAKQPIPPEIVQEYPDFANFVANLASGHFRVKQEDVPALAKVGIKAMPYLQPGQAAPAVSAPTNPQGLVQQSIAPQQPTQVAQGTPQATQGEHPWIGGTEPWHALNDFQHVMESIGGQATQERVQGVQQKIDQLLPRLSALTKGQLDAMLPKMGIAGRPRTKAHALAEIAGVLARQSDQWATYGAGGTAHPSMEAAPAIGSEQPNRPTVSPQEQPASPQAPTHRSPAFAGALVKGIQSFLPDALESGAQVPMHKIGPALSQAGVAPEQMAQHLHELEREGVISLGHHDPENFGDMPPDPKYAAQQVAQGRLIPDLQHPGHFISWLRYNGGPQGKAYQQLGQAPQVLPKAPPSQVAPKAVVPQTVPPQQQSFRDFLAARGIAPTSPEVTRLHGEHAAAVKSALDRGERVSEEVLQAHPDLWGHPTLAAPKQVAPQQGTPQDQILAAHHQLNAVAPRWQQNFINLRDLRRALPHLSREQFDAALQQLRREGRLSLSAAEGRHGISEEERAAGIPEEKSLLLHASVPQRQPQQMGRDEPPEQYAPIDVSAIVARLRRLGSSPQAAAFAKQLLAVLQRFPDLRRQVPLRELAELEQMAGNPIQSGF
jgi:phage gp29-like protein